jgi:hypothetical protein
MKSGLSSEVGFVPGRKAQVSRGLLISESVIVPVNLKTEDRFHLTIEEYLHAVISLVDELVPFPTESSTC